MRAAWASCAGSTMPSGRRGLGAGGVVFTTIQKFAEAHGVVSERSNVVVMADEAHRSQYGFVEGGARWMREALPNATFVGFTGTPLERDDRNTIHVFGEYADVYDILSDEFLGRVAALEQKNLALETLRKLLNDQIRITERTNIVQSRKFREALEDAMLRYTNKAITTAEMISQLIDLAKSLRDAQRHGEELGLSREETAFYDALAENSSAREAMLSDTLRLMARELTEMVKNMPKLDWTQRESVRARLRRNVRRLLAKYGYPPDLAEDATQLVLRQAELSTENSE